MMHTIALRSNPLAGTEYTPEALEQAAAAMRGKSFLDEFGVRIGVIMDAWVPVGSERVSISVKFDDPDRTLLHQ